MNKEFEKSIREIKRLLHRGDIKRIAERAGVSQPLVTHVLNKSKEPESLTQLQLKAYKAAKKIAAENKEAIAKALQQ